MRKRKAGPVRRVFQRIDNGLRIALRPFQIVSNFIFLSISYFLGIGLSSIFYRLGPGKKKESAHPESYWRKVPAPPKDRDAWLRPF